MYFKLLFNSEKKIVNDLKLCVYLGTFLKTMNLFYEKHVFLVKIGNITINSNKILM